MVKKKQPVKKEDVRSAAGIDGSKRAEEALRESEERFRNMSNLLPQTVFETDEKGDFTFVNRQGFEMFGYSEADVTAGINVLETIIPQDRDRAVENISRRIRGEDFPSQEYTAIKKDGSKFPAAIYASAIIFNSEYVGMRGTMIDLTDHRKAEEARTRSESRYRTILENMQDSYIGVDLAGNFTFINEATCRNLGYTPEELIGSNFSVTAPGQDDVKAIFKAYNEVYETGEPQKGFAFKIIRKDGSTAYAETSISLLKDEHGRTIGFRSVGRDVSERKQVEDALKESEQNHRLLAAYHKQLNDISISFSEAVDTQDLFNRIAETLRLLTGAVASSFSVYDQETRELKVVSLSIDPMKQDKVSSVFGPEMFELRIPVSSDDMNEMFSQGIRRPKDLHELSSGLIPQDLSDALMDAAGCQQIVALAITYSTELTGTCVAYLPADQPIVPDEALKTFIYLSGLAIKRRKTEDALRDSEANYRLLAEHTTDTVWLMDMNLKTKYQSPSAAKFRGFTPQEILEMPPEKHATPESLKLVFKVFSEELPRVEADPGYNPTHTLDLEYYHKDGTTVWAESKFSVIRDESGKPVSILAEARDITERKRAEVYREMGREVLQILNEPGDLQDSIQRVLATLKTRTGLDAVGIRLQDGDDFPYFAQQGFSRDFLLTENTLVERGADGGVCRDQDGNVSLECTCGLVISGRTDPVNPLFTAGGSSWTNDSFPFLDVPPDEDPRHRPRNQCIHQGYASVALVPIHSKERIVGLIQLNDRRKGRFTLETIELLEAIASHIGEALMRKKAEDAVRESERRFKSIVEHITDIFYILDSNHKMLYVSPQIEKVLGYITEEVQNNWRNYMTDNPLNLAGREKSQLAMTTGEKQDPYMLEFTHGDGIKRLVEINESPIKNAKDEVIGIVGAARDVTERMRIESTLKESEEKYRMVVENAMEAIFVAADGMIKFSNYRAAVLSGYSQEEFTSRPFIEFIHPDDRQMEAERHIQLLQGMDIPYPYTFRIFDKAGNLKWVEISTARITWEGKPATLNFLTDVSDRKRLEEEQQRVEKLESVGVLAGGIAHDFNNILTAILGNISLASMEAQEGSELHGSLEEAQKAVLRAKDLTKQLLTFSKGGAPVTKLSSLTELLKDTSDFALRGSNVKCEFSIPVDLWHADIDAGQVSQVIHNLVINAQQAMPEGGTIELTAQNIVLSETRRLGKGLPLKKGNYIRIAIADHLSLIHISEPTRPY